MNIDIESKCLMCGIDTGHSVLCKACIDRMNNGEFSIYDVIDKAASLGFDVSKARRSYSETPEDDGGEDDPEDRTISSIPLKIASGDDDLLSFIMAMIEDYTGRDDLKWKYSEGVRWLYVDPDLFRAIGNKAVQNRGYEDLSDYYSQMEPFE